MASLDDLFPDRSACYLALFQDAVYEHNSSFEYSFVTGQFQRRNRVAVLLYWFSVLKPFHLNFTDGQNPPPEEYVQAYFNEYFAYFIICLGLHTQGVNLTFHDDKEFFKEFLNQLHFRNLSRSSLEFFLPANKTKP